MELIRILIADDHTLLRDALAELLDAEDDFDVVAVAGNAAETVRLAAELRPHVLLLDIEMPGNQDPATTVRHLRRAAPETHVMVLTMHDDPGLVQALLPLGIRGFLHKTVSHQSLAGTVRDVCAGGSRVTISLSAPSLAAPAPADNAPLSVRETQVMELAASGLSNYRIARRLDIAEGTVKRHMRNIFDKLDAGSRVEAANKAVERGLIAPPVTAPRGGVRDTRRLPDVVLRGAHGLPEAALR
ncbi:response regulator transcription factor [Streptomyces sp. A1547]|uniref:response regulator n=1 Tax=Streptomyces sp. A1547 TaxID=2563105 RepID=UPI00109E842D|nr:response regulator transcription factor [Streptomyces sp. A1547]THA33446.1 response regulator transcription factor [Streptomyces sp. A1547]